MSMHLTMNLFLLIPNVSLFNSILHKKMITMGSHKKPLCVGKCTSEDLDFIFFFLGWGEGGGGRRYVPSRLDSKSVFVKYLLSIALPMTHGSCLISNTEK